jgi:hypothetical protein
MRGRVSQYQVRLNRKPKRRLEALVRRRTPLHYMVMRAKIVLASANGLSLGRICEAHSLDHQVVRRWIKRYVEFGYDGLKDQKRSGRPPAISPSVWQKVTTVIVHSARAMVRSRSVVLPSCALRMAGEPRFHQPLLAVDGAQTS